MTNEQMDLDLLLAPYKEKIVRLHEEIDAMKLISPWVNTNSLNASIGGQRNKIDRIKDSYKVRYRRVVTRYNYV